MKWYQLESWHKTRTGLAVFGLIELGLSYLFASLAINSGSLWQWALSTVLVFGALSNLIRIFLKH